MCLRAEINSQIQENVKVNMKIHNTSTAPLIFTNPNLLFSFFFLHPYMFYLHVYA